MYLKKSIIGMTEKDLRDFSHAHGFEKFHGSQLFRWIYCKLATSFTRMSDIPAPLRQLLETRFCLSQLNPSKRSISQNNDAIKYSFSLEDGNEVEAVVLTADDRDKRLSFCISCQIGCPVGCSFCATGSMGFLRNMNSGEIITEILSLMKLHNRPHSILFMGMGEPLLNIENVLKAIGLLNDIGLSSRRITISTCGVTGGIYKLADSGYRPRLAISIGSAIEEKRKRIIPLAEKNPLSILKKALCYYREKTGRRVSIEYTIIKDVNDTDNDARTLASYAKSTLAHVNLIRYNRVEAKSYLPPDTHTVERFKTVLRAQKIEVSERYRKGNDIHAACGQLVTRAKESKALTFS
jgi:23S rRNA (adenine2503-C2)-methyltransferase